MFKKVEAGEPTVINSLLLGDFILVALQQTAQRVSNFSHNSFARSL
jgi:hypothetical protein